MKGTAFLYSESFVSIERQLGRQEDTAEHKRKEERPFHEGPCIAGAPKEV